MNKNKNKMHSKRPKIAEFPFHSAFELYKVEHADDFWDLFDEMKDDESGFLHNRNWILDAFKRGDMYTLCLKETTEMFENQVRFNSIFCTDSFLYKLPCFCITERHDNECVDILWVHSRARRMKVGTNLVQLLKIKRTTQQLEGSEDFWSSLHL